MAQHAKRLTLMPIPPIEEHMAIFDAGTIVIGVEYRLLNDAIVNQHMDRQDHRIDLGDNIDDRGVAIHVFEAPSGASKVERLRFDCFDEGPHYHYIDWQAGTNDIVQIDPVADGDPLAWALERIQTRLPQMLERAGASAAATSVDAAQLEAVMPRVCEAAYRARYQHDDQQTLRAALA